MNIQNDPAGRFIDRRLPNLTSEQRELACERLNNLGKVLARIVIRRAEDGRRELRVSAGDDATIRT